MGKTALLSYSMRSFVDATTIAYRSIGIEMIEILNVLIDLGYKVTVADCKSAIAKDGEYDLIIGFGNPYRKNRIKNNGLRILYLTEGVPCLSEKQEKIRIERFKKKYGVNVGIQRSGVYYKSDDLINANGIIFLGDEKRRKEIMKNSISTKVFGIYPTVHIKGSYREEEKNNDNFVMITSGGVVHKGVDLVYESFKYEKNIKLNHFGGLGYLRHVLKKPNNVNYHGHVNLNDEKNKNIITKSRFVILLSASEACPTSVINAMNFGCIPIVTKHCGINSVVERVGYIIDSLNPREISEKLNEIRNEKLCILREKSRMSKKFSEEMSVESYRMNMLNAIKEIADIRL